MDREAERPDRRDDRQPWSRGVRDASFFVLLAASAVAVVALLLPFAVALLFAVVTVVVSWPLFQRVLTLCRGRRKWAAVLTMVILAVVVIGPLGTAVYLGAEQAREVVVQGAEVLQSQDAEGWAQTVEAGIADLPGSVRRFLPEDLDLQGDLGVELRGHVVTALEAVGQRIPAWIEGTLMAALGVVIYLFAVPVLFVEGPALLTFAMRISPMDDRYERRLFRSFRRLANNLLLGALATAVAQATVAAVGYAVFGVRQVFFLGLLTAAASLIPVLGSPVVWIPVCVGLALEKGWLWGAGLALYCTALVGTIDNVVRPLVMREGTPIHPLLIFLAVFGGLAWLGLPGLLIGPVLMAFFLALYFIYREDYLGVPQPAAHVPTGSRLARWLGRGLRRLRRRRDDPGGGEEQASDTGEQEA